MSKSKKPELSVNMIKPIPHPRIKDLTNQIFGDLTVLGFVTTEKRHARWLCKCRCENLVVRSSDSLMSGIRQGRFLTCGCCAPKILDDGFQHVPHTIQDFTGKTIGQLTIDGYVGKGGKPVKRHYWKCRCICGKVVLKSSAYLFDAVNNQHDISCGCKIRISKIKNLTGQRFGRLVALEPIRSRWGIRWKCRCDCGNICEVLSNSLIRKQTKSCGCILKYSDENTVYINQYFSHVKAGAKHRELFFNLTYEEFYNIVTSKYCTYCSETNNFMSLRSRNRKLKIKFRLMSVDRYDSSKGYTVDNCVPCCNVCQKRKLDTHGDKYILDTINKGKYLAKKFKHQIPELEKAVRKRAENKNSK